MTNRIRTRTRRALLWVGVPVATFVAVVVIGEIVGWPFLRKPLQEAMTGAAKVPVLLEGDFGVRFIWRPHLKVEHLQVAAAPGVEGKSMDAPHLLDARDIDLRWSWLDIWRWHGGAPLRVSRLHASKLDARLLRDAAGHATWQIGDRSKTPAEPATGSTELPQFGSLQVAQGTIVLDDQMLDTDLRVEINGGEGSTPAQSGYRASVKGRWQKLPLDLKITSGAVLPLLADDRAGAGATPSLDFSVKGTAGAATVSFEGGAAAVFGARDLDGALVFSGPSLAQVGEPLGVTLPTTPPFELRGRLAHKGGIWHLKADRASIGSSRLNGDFHFDPTHQPPLLTGNLGGTRLALADLGPAVGAPVDPAASAAAAAPPKSAKAPPKDRVLPDKHFDLPSLRAMDADVQVAIDELDFGSPSLAPLQRVKTRIGLDDSVLKLDALSAVVAGGDFDGSTQLDARGKEARWALDLRFGTVDVAAWLQGLRAGSAPASAPSAADTKAVVAERKQARAGGEQPIKSYLTGALTGRLNVTGRGNSTAEILGRVDGDASILLRDGSISHLVTEGVDLDIAQALGVLVKGDTPLPLRCARLELKAKDGLVKIERAVLDNRDSTIRVAGIINLQDEKLALKAQSRPKDFSPLSLNTPVTVGGTLGAPAVGIDGKRLGAKVLGAAVLAAVAAPLAAVLPFIEFPKEAEQGDVCAVDSAREPPPAPAKR